MVNRNTFRVKEFYYISFLFASLLDRSKHLTLKAPIMTAADDIHKYFFIVFQRK